MIGASRKHAAAGERVETGVDQVDGPALLVAAAPLHGSGGEIDLEVARHVGELQEEALHHLGLVAERHHEFLEPVGGVELHDVPEHRVRADPDHRLGHADGLLAEPGAEAAGKDDHLHVCASKLQPGSSLAPSAARNRRRSAGASRRRCLPRSRSPVPVGRPAHGVIERKQRPPAEQPPRAAASSASSSASCGCSPVSAASPAVHPSRRPAPRPAR